MSQAASQREKLWTPANKVTLARILLIPFFVIAIISPWPEWFPQWADAAVWKPWVAAGVFIAIAATDSIDGHLARSRNEVTTLGKFMDPLADKILVASALLALIELGVLPSWVALIILAREFIVSGIRMLAASQNVVIAASWYGKAKTVTQIIAIVLFIIKDSHPVTDLGSVLSNGLYLFSWFVMLVAVVLTIVSMLDYFVKAREILGFVRADAGPGMQVKTKLAEPRQTNEELAAEVVRMANECHAVIGTAESCTGGLISGTLTHIPGSSAVVAGGIVSYSNEVKKSHLGVLESTLAQHGAVSEEVACQMAKGARDALGVDTAVAVTGIAGPGGAVPGKPVGTVWIGLSDANMTFAKLYHFEGDRERVRAQTVHEALRLVRASLATYSE